MHTLQHTHINKVIADMYVKRLGRCFFHQNKCKNIVRFYTHKTAECNIDVSMFDERS